MFRQRDAASIEPLYRAHFDAIYRFASCRVGRDVALDVAAETFHQALRSLDRLDPERDARAWLFGIATNVLRHHRRSEVRRLRAYERASALKTNDATSPSHEGASESHTLLIGALSELEPRDRETLLLLVWADLSYDEIAGALDVPIGTVRSRINRARHRLRAALAPVDDGRLDQAIAVGEER